MGTSGWAVPQEASDQSIDQRAGRIAPDVAWILSPDTTNHSRDSELLIHDYIAQLDSREIPQVLQCFSEVDTRQVVDGGFHRDIFSAWAARDPDAVLMYIRPMFQCLTSDHFLDSWGHHELLPDPDALARLPFFPQPTDFLPILDSVLASGISRERKKAFFDELMTGIREGAAGSDDVDWRKLDSFETFEKGMEKRRGKAVAEGVGDANAWRAVKSIREASLGQLPMLFHDHPRWRSITLRRWVELGPLPPMIPLWLAASVADDSGRKRFIRDVIAAWAAQDAEGACSFFRTYQPDDWVTDAASALLPHLDETSRDEVIALFLNAQSKRVPPEDDERQETVRFFVDWGRTDPEGAFHAAERILRGDENFGSFARGLFYARRQGPHERRVAPLLLQSDRHLPDEYSYVIMEEFGDLDVGMAAQYGVKWMLREIAKPRDAVENGGPYFTRERIIAVWSGNSDPGDASMDDRTFGCLRKWAACAPKAMKKWIETSPQLHDQEIRAALVWIADHPNRVAP
ncbi:MAG: hypothetical protein R3F19_03920 [Verrucomicrobiales bacterium]